MVWKVEGHAPEMLLRLSECWEDFDSGILTCPDFDSELEVAHNTLKSSFTPTQNIQQGAAHSPLNVDQKE